jgi:tetratricopeptide (TPR) repeat protein
MSLRSMRIGLTGWIVMAAACGARAADAPPADAAPALAWRLDGISSAQLGPGQPDSAWKRSAALLEAAGRLSPTEPRFPRLAAMVKLHLDDVDGAIAAVRAYRQIVPSDRRAQGQLIDLYTARMETVDAKVNYLRGLVDKQDLAPEIRSHIASACATLLNQKSKQEAIDMAKKAVELYPLAEAARQYYELHRA